MSDDLIRRQDAIEWLTTEWDGMVTSVFDGIKRLPSAETERLTGHWIHVGDGYTEYCKCSECGNLSDVEENFCCECGADMRGADDEIN